MPLPLSQLFPDEDYRFHLTLRKGDLAEFFAAPSPSVLAERRQWLADGTNLYAAVTDEAEPVLAETEALVAGTSGSGTLLSRLQKLGGELEPDFMLMLRDGAGVFRLRAGVVCFPSSWALTEKMGLTLDEIHGVVPGLNPAMSSTIGQFLGRLKPGIPYERANWGLAATPELNMHPTLRRPRLAPPLDLSRLWVRIEDQILAALPVSGGILFGIRLRLVPVSELLADPQLRAGFHRAVSTMEEPLAAYKGIAPMRAELIAASAGG